MVQAVRTGTPQRAVARRFRVALSTVQFWADRAGNQRLDRVDWTDRSHRPHHPRRTDAQIEELVLSFRRELQQISDLGEYGADAIHRELVAGGLAHPPCTRSIGRILQRHGALDGRGWIRRPPPPRGWYLPAVAQGEAELDCFDIVEGLKIKHGPLVELLNGISLHGGLPTSWPIQQVTAKMIVESLIEHWRCFGLPGYAQFDNDTCFQGAHQFPNTIGRVTRLCLSLGVIPVFTPPRETGFQAAIEAFNGRWQAKVWARFLHASLQALCTQSAKYVQAARKKNAPRIDAAPQRAAFPKRWHFDPQQHPQGTIIYLRRTNEQGKLSMLGHTFSVDPHWPHRLIRAEVDLKRNQIRFYALRRTQPNHQPLLNKLPHTIPKRLFQG
jgi:hypothetical protein